MNTALQYQSISLRDSNLIDLKTGEIKSIPILIHIIAASILFCALSLKVWIKLQCTEEGYKLAKEKQLTVNLDMERRELELHKSVLLKPDNLIMRSRKKLGLLQLNPAQAKKVYY